MNRFKKLDRKKKTEPIIEKVDEDPNGLIAWKKEKDAES